MRPIEPRAFLLYLLLVVLLVVAAGVASAGTWPPPPASVKGELAFSETIVFDYNRDGTPDRVQFWIELEGHPASGQPGQAGAREERGWVSYFVLDVERQQRIDDWLLPLNMGGGFPMAGERYPLTNIRIEGKTAQFELRGSTWTITDGGDTWGQDKIEIETAGRKREGRFYAGNVTVTADPRTVWEPVNIRENRRCNRCHRDAAVSMAAEGGPHAELPCAACHTEHPPDAPGAVPQCFECHDAHIDTMQAASCSGCHSSHNAKRVAYGITVPDEHCAACHQESAASLLASGTRHMGVACAICHRSEHGAIPTCIDCHGGPHPERVMSRPERCVRCHQGAHETVIKH